ncbi:MAG: hypothetical protein GXY36_03250 [Chloroflexi bacterium]|nr:hypothetical protein [Chloroflexota bacterium]
MALTGIGQTRTLSPLAHWRRHVLEDRWWVPLAFWAILLAIVVMVSLPQSPSMSRQGRDSGVYVYTARVILDGGVPYRDVWDNKTPLVFFTNAAALLFFGPDLWSLWIIQILSFAATGGLFFGLLSRLYAGQTRLIWGGTLLFLFQAHHYVLNGAGNFSELYALLPQVVCLIAGYRFLEQPRARWVLLLGASAGIAFLFKQNTVGVALAAVPALLLVRSPLLQSRRRWHWLALAIAGGLSVLGAMAFYLAARGALYDAFMATFVSPSQFHNWVSGRSVPPWETLRGTLTSPAVLLTMGPLAPLAIYGWVLGVRRGLAKQIRSRRDAILAAFALWVALTFVLDMALANLSNRAGDIGYAHYFITPMPAFVLLSMPALKRLANFRPRQRRERALRLATWAYIVLVTVLWLPVTLIGQMIVTGSNPLGDEIEHPLKDYITETTSPEDSVLIWGASSMLNFQTQRPSPSRFHYGYPLIVPGEYSQENIDQFVDDLEANQPALIVDATLNDGDRIPPLDPYMRAAWWVSGGRRDVADLSAVYDFVSDHCATINRIDAYRVYRCEYDSRAT